jgi:hypothetical protein
LLRHALTAALIYWLLADKNNAWPEFAVPSGPCSGRRRNPKGFEVAAAVLRPKDVFGRLGGEEFVVLFLASSIEAACARAERVRGFFAQDCRFARECHVTRSGGMSASVKSEQTLEELLHVPTLRSTARCKGPHGGIGARYRKAHATRKHVRYSALRLGLLRPTDAVSAALAHNGSSTAADVIEDELRKALAICGGDAVLRITSIANAFPEAEIDRLSAGVIRFARGKVKNPPHRKKLRRKIPTDDVQTAEEASMVVTYFVAPVPRQVKHRSAKSEAAAIRRAEGMSRDPAYAGAVAFKRAGDPNVGEFSDAVVLKKFGDVPEDLSAL